jgi:hypothetical protein
MKLSLEALKERAEATASIELLATISGGLENDCHDVPTWTVDCTCTTTPATGTPSMSMSEFYHALGQFFIRTGL